MIIRALTESDIGRLTDLLLQLGYPSNIGTLKNRFEKIRQHPDYQTLVAEYDGKVVGMIGLSKSYYYELDGFYVRILALIVDSDYRNQGIGKKLIDDAEKWARTIGASGISLNTGNRPERLATHRFYKNRGYNEKSIGFVKSLL